MALSTTLSLHGAGAGTLFGGELRQLGHDNFRVSKRPRKQNFCSCWNGSPFPNQNCIWGMPSANNFHLKSMECSPLFAVEGEAEDGFLSNMNDDTDDMYDDLFKKFGNVVFKSNDQKPPSAEIDDDAESLSFAVSMAKVASDVKAADIRVLFVKPLVYWTRFFIIATAFSRPQIDAIGSRIRDLAEKKYGRSPSGDVKPNSWTLLDFGDVVIHIFLPQQRAFYNLEEFYGNATPVELPFENQRPF
ncbi:protein Iojap, chloroplastic isoform X2 [Benincasa hispida]|uniref:protein Iojap, chloroplastic isoform X2 n=1 Tax=Benincasa hispida TaxID=102211 RepID=UPI0019010272|nr:protein Iojap, chloroplastic isoform X2 [Benincasa hispida]